MIENNELPWSIADIPKEIKNPVVLQMKNKHYDLTAVQIMAAFEYIAWLQKKRSDMMGKSSYRKRKQISLVLENKHLRDDLWKCENLRRNAQFDVQKLKKDIKILKNNE